MLDNLPDFIKDGQGFSKSFERHNVHMNESFQEGGDSGDIRVAREVSYA